MLFSKAPLAALIVALAGCASASPIDNGKVLIGYALSTENDKLPVKAPYDKTYELQLGNGIYTFAKKGQLPPPQNKYEEEHNLYCAVYADRGAMDRVGKAWIPKYWFKGKGPKDTEQVWNKPKVIDEYIKTQKKNWDPAKTLRMSIFNEWVVDGKKKDGTDNWVEREHADQFQLVIPDGLRNENDGSSMKIEQECTKNRDSLSNEVVNYDQWHQNIAGERVSTPTPGLGN